MGIQLKFNRRNALLLGAVAALIALSFRKVFRPKAQRLDSVSPYRIELGFRG